MPEEIIASAADLLPPDAIVAAVNKVLHYSIIREHNIKVVILLQRGQLGAAMMLLRPGPVRDACAKRLRELDTQLRTKK